MDTHSKDCWRTMNTIISNKNAQWLLLSGTKTKTFTTNEYEDY